MPRPLARLGLAGLIAGSAIAASLAADEPPPSPTARWRQHDMKRPHPPVAEPAEDAIASKPPKDAVILFNGSTLDAWKASDGGPARWTVADGYMETRPGAGGIETRQAFGDIQLHVEWAAPSPPHGQGQDRGNSGVFLMNQFEVQVLDSYQADTYADGQAGAIYGQYPPLFNASRPPGEWQSYDIAFRRPRFDSAGKLLESARITVFHNGLLVQDNEEPFGPTSWLKWLPYEGLGDRGPIALQDHDHPVRYRNIWLRELPERAAPSAKDRARPQVVTLAADVLERCAGQYLLGDKPGAAKATIRREGDHLSLSLPFRPQPLDLVPVSETDFVLPDTDARFTFHADPGGRVTGARFQVGDSERELRKLEP